MVEILGVKTYLDLIEKYPETRDYVLELRRQKNQAFYIVSGVAFMIGMFIGYEIGVVL